jgi:oligopeptide/dipeptide ABC transporter ATP-binding protein
MQGVSNDSDALLEVSGLRITLRTDDGVAQILDDVSLRVRPGEIVGVVGESGCGKSTLVKAILGIMPQGAVVERGSILFDGIDLLRLDEAAMTRDIRGSRIGFIPQDPLLALNPMFTVGAQFMELMRWHAPVGEGGGRRVRRRAHRARLIELLNAVQMPDPEAALQRYPHQFSGGQRQRLIIAAALACAPQLLIADEPTSALDVTIQLQILHLLQDLSREMGVSVVFVTHDFGVVSQLCDRVSVIYAGQTVEHAPTDAILDDPKHPYTRMLLRCHPDYAQDLVAIPGAVPSPLQPPPGCRFNPRCPSALPACHDARPPAHRIADGGAVHCVLYQ